MVKLIPGIWHCMIKWFTTNVFNIMYQCHLMFNEADSSHMLRLVKPGKLNMEKV